ncbi:hypothetical protein ETAE_0326 [Edwardsiella piscicida]|uniref:Uncharacterized protein n=2 Tax=Edwardsiella TaxID=635 RepID=A0A0H3DML6_EDWTF|nr:hypothetical protein ETAE_0326 [Edwardsiella tarda EIB202]ADM40404.1 hypothetical protein ETAF_0280 [Edwardsiella tarda FL6-60]
MKASLILPGYLNHSLTENHLNICCNLIFLYAFHHIHGQVSL